MPTPPSEADIIFQRANVALAKSQRLIATWLPPPTGEEETEREREREREEEEERMFEPVPELLGVGATIPKDGDVKRQELSSNEKLRRQLLGRELAKLYGRAGSRGKASSGGLVPMGSKPRPIVAKRLAEEEEEEEEEEGGRTSVGKSKRRREVNRQGLEETANRTDMSKVMESEQTELGSRPRKASNYLDEVLAERQRKKQKKKRKQNT